MSHEGHHEHGGGNGTDGGCPMQMIFHGGNCEKILFESWEASTVGSFVFVVIAVFVVGVLYEGLKYLRERMLEINQKAELSVLGSRNKSESQLVALPERTMRDHMLTKHHCMQTFLHFFQVAISYALMLIVMTYNLWLFFAVVLGACTGYFCFGWIRNRSIDVTEHCH